MKRNRCWVYDDSKPLDVLNNPNKYKDLRAFIFNNCEPSSLVNNILRDLGTKEVYLKINLFNLTVPQFEDEMLAIKNTGLDGIAVDGEAYAGSTIWSDFSSGESKAFGEAIAQVLKENNLKCILLPENLGGKKYLTYQHFVDGLSPEVILMERSYNEWKPWILKKLWDRNKNTPGIKAMGIWQDSFPWYAFVCKWIQYITAHILSKDIFWYTERKLK